MLYQLNQTTPSQSPRQPILNPNDLGLTEKQIEEFVASHLNELIPEDQLMLIGQERKRQEEADLLALDRNGTLYIFELKKWISSTENLLQVLRYGQIFGRYSYQELQDLAVRNQKLQGTLQEGHRRHFGLVEPLPESKFNIDQVFILITNGADHDTLDAISYWSQKGICIDSITYKLYRINDKPYIYFDVYNPAGEVILEENAGNYVVNTNLTYMPDAWRDMLSKSKAAAYYDRKYAVAGIPKGSTIYLYHTGTGIIAKGRSTAVCQHISYANDPDAEYYVPLHLDWQLDDPASWGNAVKAWEVNQKLGSGHRFRQTAFTIKSVLA